MSARRTLFHNGRVYDGRPGHAATSLAVEDGRVVFVGDEDAAAAYDGSGLGAGDVVDLQGALLTPAFVDAHVHTVRTGFVLTGLDLTGIASPLPVLRRLVAAGTTIHDHEKAP